MTPDEQTRSGQTGAERTDERTPEEIRGEIEQTREELGDTVEALAAKTDVKAQAKDRAAGLKNAAQAKTDDLTAKARALSPDSAAAGAQHVGRAVQREPVPFAAGGAFAAGLFLGWMIGRRR